MRAVLWLQDITASDGGRVGTKALNLANVARAGFSVPAGFCIVAAAYEEYLSDNALRPAIDSLLSSLPSQMHNEAMQLQEAIRSGIISPELREVVLSAYGSVVCETGTLPPAVAVRSSASTEDLPEASFAGQQATLLNVRGEQQLLHAVLECWASLWSPRAVSYRAQRRAGAKPSMAVLVQRMVDADVAGVAFSQHPTSGEERVVVEGTFGLGELVVSGEADVDRYVVDRETLAEVEQPFIAHKPRRRSLAAGGGVQEVEVPAELHDARAMTPQQVRQVAEAVLALERCFGCPQDVEWAFAEGRLFVLQSRPMTTTARSVFTDLLPGDSLWTAGFLNERFPLPVSPLGWSLVRELLEELAFRDPLRYLGLDGVERLRVTRLYRGHPYVSMFVFQTLYKVFPDFLLPEDAYRYFPDGATGLRRQVGYPRSLLDPRFLLSMVRHLLNQPAVWSPWHNHRVWRAFVVRHGERHQQLQSRLRGLHGGVASEQQIWAVMQQAQELNAELLSFHRWSLTLADLAYSLLRRLVRAWGDEEAAAICARLVTGLANKSLEVDCALRDLAQMEGTPAFESAFSAFLAQYGHRSFSLDIYYPPFVDDPEQVLGLLPGLRRERIGLGKDYFAAREESQRCLRLWLARGPFGWLKWALFGHVLGIAQQYVPLREEQRFYWQKTLSLIRSLFLLLGKRMAEAGVLQAAQHIFLLTKDEIGGYVSGEARADAYAALAAIRQRQFASLRREFDAAPSLSYPQFLCGNQPLTSGSAPCEHRFKGRAVSPGLARGRVVVLFSPAGFNKVKPGDVLVTRSVDPGWTPIFGLLNGLVIEHGGQLSHGAVVAREYGLPTVAGISGITRWLHDGDIVIVDGLNGIVARVTNERGSISEDA